LVSLLACHLVTETATGAVERPGRVRGDGSAPGPLLARRGYPGAIAALYALRALPLTTRKLRVAKQRAWSEVDVRAISRSKLC
jgi:hypothetical protein